MTKLLKSILFLFLFIPSAFASTFTTNYRFEVPDERSYDWNAIISNDYISTDRILKIISNDVNSIAPAILTADIADLKNKTTILSNDAVLQDNKITIISSDVGTAKTHLLSTDASIIGISTDAGVIKTHLFSTDSVVIGISTDVGVMKALDTIISNDAGSLKNHVISTDSVIIGISSDISKISTDIIRHDKSIGILSADAVIQDNRITILSNDSSWVKGATITYNNPIANKIGIGTQTAGSALSVRGAISQDAIAGTDFITIISSDGSTSILKIDKNNNVGIGTTAPIGRLNISQSNVSAQSFIFNDNYEDTAGAYGARFVGRRARGTLALPTAIKSGDEIVGLGGRGYGATGFSAGPQVGISYWASQDWTDTAYGTNIRFWTTLNNSITLTERMRIDNAGNVGIGTTNPTTKLSVAGIVSIDSILNVSGDIIGYGTINVPRINIMSADIGIISSDTASLKSHAFSSDSAIIGISVDSGVIKTHLLSTDAVIVGISTDVGVIKSHLLSTDAVAIGISTDIVRHNKEIGILSADAVIQNNKLTIISNDAVGMKEAAIEAMMDGGSSAIVVGDSAVIVEMPFNFTLQSATLLLEPSGTVSVDIWKDTYANFPPTDADSITGNYPLSITSGTKSQDTVLSGWTTAFSKGDILIITADVATTTKKATVSLKGIKR